jgi:hypothetical protein
MNGRFKGAGQQNAHVHMAAGNLLRAMNGTKRITRQMVASEASRHGLSEADVLNHLSKRGIRVE